MMVIKIAIKMAVMMMMMVLTTPLTSNQLSLHPAGHQHTLILVQLGLHIFLLFKSAIALLASNIDIFPPPCHLWHPLRLNASHCSKPSSSSSSPVFPRSRRGTSRLLAHSWSTWCYNYSHIMTFLFFCPHHSLISNLSHIMIFFFFPRPHYHHADRHTISTCHNCPGSQRETHAWCIGPRGQPRHRCSSRQV